METFVQVIAGPRTAHSLDLWFSQISAFYKTLTSNSTLFLVAQKDVPLYGINFGKCPSDFQNQSKWSILEMNSQIKVASLCDM